ncbi:MAG: heme exporter protein CcmD [bacterium]
MMNAEFWNMGGYALYVWGSFGATFLFLIIEPLMVRQRRRAVIKRVSRLIRMNKEGNS